MLRLGFHLCLSLVIISDGKANEMYFRQTKIKIDHVETSLSVWSGISSSLAECSVRCFDQSNCVSLLYNFTEASCKLFDVIYNTDGSVGVGDVVYYTLESGGTLLVNSPLLYTGGDACPDDFLWYHNVCLTLPQQKSLDWSDAVEKCQDIGGSLSTIHNAGKQQILENFISEHFKGSNENINLPPKYRYHYLDDYLTFHSFIIKEKRIKFEVMGCNDAHLILSESRTDSVNAYEIVIGGWKNNQSVIRIDKQGQAMANASHSPLSCNTFKPFWVSWENGTIETGEGKEIGNGKFMKWTDPKPHTVNFIGISSWHTAEAHWKFNKDPYNATFWLGGTDLEHSRHYTNWLPDEPKYPITDGHCIHLSLDRDFRWATDNCTLKRNFICELDTSLVSTNADSG